MGYEVVMQTYQTVKMSGLAMKFAHNSANTHL